MLSGFAGPELEWFRHQRYADALRTRRYRPGTGARIANSPRASDSTLTASAAVDVSDGIRSSVMSTPGTAVPVTASRTTRGRPAPAALM
jgi:hypothetical protein